MKISLNGDWLFRQFKTGEWERAVVPGCNYLDLLRLNKIPDPFIGTNEKDTYWVAKKDWEYKREFTVNTELLSFDCIRLECDMLDTICDVYVNDKLVGKGENTHIKYAFDIKEYINEGTNEIRIVFFSPVNYALEQKRLKDDDQPKGDSEGIAHIRKPQCHFGWDWGPNLPPSGINRNIQISAYNQAKIKDVKILQTHTNGKVNLNISAELERFTNENLSYKITVISPDSSDVTAENQIAKNSFGTEVIIEKPELWWTRDLSDKDEQPLYTVKLEVLQNGETVDELIKKIGLRVIELNTDKDQYGRNFQFKINGAPLFIKGVNWIPPDSFIDRYSEERMEYDLDAIKFSNMNMIRIWGGGYYESDLLYDKCDRDGILLWQEFAFACRPYPFFDNELLFNVKKEAEYNVRRLRHHACLAVWSGNNEIECLSDNWKSNKIYMQWTEIFYYNILPHWMEDLDNITPYIPGSPCGIDHMQGYDRDNVGDTHLWAVWHGLQPLDYYRKRMTRFCSEFGFESLPDLKTIEKFAKPEDYSLTSEVFSAHQKCWSGNMKMAYYIASKFRLPKNFEDYVYLSQLCQQECVRDATEHWRRNKGRCNGSMYWQFNDCWPVCSWAGMDYYGNYKALQYSARHFNAPITVSLEDTKDYIKIVAVNDTRENVYAKIVWRLIDFNGKEYAKDSRRLTVLKLRNETVFNIKTSELKKKVNLKKAVFVAEMFIDDILTAQRTVLFYPEKNLSLPKANIRKTITAENGTVHISLTSDKFVRSLQVHSKTNTLPFTDNYFDLLPGETKLISQKIPDGMTAEELEKDITLFSLSDVVPENNKMGDVLERLRILSIDSNYKAYLQQRKIPEDLPLGKK